MESSALVLSLHTVSKLIVSLSNVFANYSSGIYVRILYGYIIMQHRASKCVEVTHRLLLRELLATSLQHAHRQYEQSK